MLDKPWPELKQIWVDALRSGDYKQTKGTLHNLDDGGFCCIGVACVVWGIATPEKIGVIPYVYGVDEGISEYYSLWRSVHTSLKTVQPILTGMNDKGYAFTEIAKFIEEKL